MPLNLGKCKLLAWEKQIDFDPFYINDHNESHVSESIHSDSERIDLIQWKKCRSRIKKYRYRRF